MNYVSLIGYKRFTEKNVEADEERWSDEEDEEAKQKEKEVEAEERKAFSFFRPFPAAKTS